MGLVKAIDAIIRYLFIIRRLERSSFTSIIIDVNMFISRLCVSVIEIEIR